MRMERDVVVWMVDEVPAVITLPGSLKRVGVPIDAIFLHPFCLASLVFYSVYVGSGASRSNHWW
jgi:hypothetical protein